MCLLSEKYGAEHHSLYIASLDLEKRAFGTQTRLVRTVTIINSKVRNGAVILKPLRVYIGVDRENVPSPHIFILFTDTRAIQRLCYTNCFMQVIFFNTLQYSRSGTTRSK